MCWVFQALGWWVYLWQMSVWNLRRLWSLQGTGKWRIEKNVNPARLRNQWPNLLNRWCTATLNATPVVRQICERDTRKGRNYEGQELLTMSRYRKETIDYINDRLDLDVRDLKIRMSNDYLKTLEEDLTQPERTLKLSKTFNLGIKAIERILASKDD